MNNINIHYIRFFNKTTKTLLLFKYVIKYLLDDFFSKTLDK